MTMKWYLNGHELGDFRGLSEANIKSLKHVGTHYGCEIFTSDKVPKGTLELRDSRGKILAVIRGIGD